MASFIKQTYELPDGITKVVLQADGVAFTRELRGGGSSRLLPDRVVFGPCTVDEANQMSVVLKLAAAHLEKMVKGLK